MNWEPNSALLSDLHQDMQENSHDKSQPFKTGTKRYQRDPDRSFTSYPSRKKATKNWIDFPHCHHFHHTYV